MRQAIEVMWHSDAAWATIARAALAPAALAFRGATGVRNALYDRGALPIHEAALPVVSVGNLSVGGTGKTPVAAWMAAHLMSRGARPALVLRGYGDDEPLVHAMLNPDVPVIVNADRLAAVRDAQSRRCDVVICDDAFQHRRLARLEDVVLASVEGWVEPIRLLPAGPWREAPGALARASMVIVTRKAARRDDAEALMQRLISLTRSGRGAVAALALDQLRDAVTGEAQPLSCIAGTSVLVAAGIGDPVSLSAQLQHAGARVELRAFPDHHNYSVSDVMQLARDARAFDHVLCTLKDAVKLAPRWPREAPPLLYVSLRCEIEVGGAEVSALFDRVLMARSTRTN